MPDPLHARSRRFWFLFRRCQTTNHCRRHSNGKAAPGADDRMVDVITFYHSDFLGLNGHLVDFWFETICSCSGGGGGGGGEVGKAIKLVPFITIKKNQTVTGIVNIFTPFNSLVHCSLKQTNVVVFKSTTTITEDRKYRFWFLFLWLSWGDALRLTRR